MIDDQPPAVRGGGAFSALARDGLTHVELTWIEKKLEHWIRFGRVAQDRILTRRTRVVGFRPGAVFAFVRWASNDVGTVVSRLDILRAVRRGEGCSTVPGVAPGGELLVRQSGWANVKRALETIDAVEALGLDPAAAAPDYWRHVHSRLVARQAPRAYSLARHRAWCLREELGA